MGKFKGMNSPADSKIKNPLKKGKDGKLKADHDKTLKASGLHPPKSPI